MSLGSLESITRAYVCNERSTNTSANKPGNCSSTLVALCLHDAVQTTVRHRSTSKFRYHPLRRRYFVTQLLDIIVWTFGEREKRV